MDDMDHFEDGASRQLTAIHAGGRRLLIIVRQRVAKALDEMDAGDFAEATAKLNEAAHFLGSLASAQNYIAIADGALLMPAADLSKGMVLSGIGEVDEVDVHSCPSTLCRRHVELKVGDHELKFYGDQEVYVER